MKVRGIPPLTSTGRNRRATPAPLNGLAHMSLGRYMSEMARHQRKEEAAESWSVPKYSRPDVNRKHLKQKTVPVIYSIDHKITCIVKMHNDYNEEGDFAISLHFHGIKFASEIVSTCFDEARHRCFLIPVYYSDKAKESSLFLTTIGDIFEFEIVLDINDCCVSDCFLGHTKKAILKNGEKEFCFNRLFRDEAYIPELLQKYDPLSMNAIIKDSNVIVTYKRK